MAATAPPENASNADLIRWSFESLNAHDMTRVRPYWTATTVERFPDRTVTGPDEILAYFEEILSALPDAHMEIEHLVAEGDAVFVRWRLTGTHTGGPFGGIDATGRRIELDGIDHFTVRDGKVVSNFVVFDQMEVGRAMGLLPPDGSAPDKALKAAFNAKTKVAGKLAERRGR